MSKRQPSRGVICSCSSCLIWDVKLRHLNKSCLQFLATAQRPTCLSKMSTGKKDKLTDCRPFSASRATRDASWGIGFFLLASAPFWFLPLFCWFYALPEMSLRKAFSATILPVLHIHLKWLLVQCGRDGRPRNFPYWLNGLCRVRIIDLLKIIEDTFTL